MSSKVIDLGVSRKRICNFLLLFNSNYRFMTQLAQISSFSHPHRGLTPHSGGTLSDISVIYTLLKSTLKKFVVTILHSFCRY